MGEYVPVVSDGGGITAFASLGADFISIITRLTGVESGELGGRIFYWRKGGGVDVTDISRGGIIDLGDDAIILDRLLDKTKNILAYTFESVDEVAEYIARRDGRRIAGSRVLLSFSGGKDSVVALAVLSELRSFVSFDLKVVYSYVPYLESVSSLRFIDEVSRRMGVDIEIVEPKREIVLHSFRKYGMPRRGFRWCTYLKIRPIRRMKKRIKADFEAKADRYAESYKRFQNLLEYAKQGMFVSGKQMRPTYFMTFLDVLRVTRKLGLVHPHYLKGCPRVACEFCPYRNLYEFEISSEDVEDPGFLESVIKESYESYRKEGIDEELYWNLHLWRYHPVLAKSVELLWRRVEGREDSMKLEEVVEIFSSPWKRPLPRAPLISVDEAVRLMLSLREADFGVHEVKNW